MTSLPSVVEKSDRIGVHGYTSQDTYYDLFRQLYPLYGTQGRVIAILLAKLHAHVTLTLTDAPSDDIRVRERHLLDILHGITFGDTPRPDDRGNGHQRVASPPGQTEGTNSECSQTHLSPTGGE